MAVAIEKLLTLGVDTHLDKHVSVLINNLGQIVSTSEFETTTGGYQSLLRWCKSYGELQKAGIEGTGTYGAGLYRFLDQQNIPVFEVTRPNRIKRRQKGKTDTLDAENAARAALSGEAQAIPKKQTGVVEALRYLVVTRRSAVKGKTQSINQIRALLVTAPADVRAQLLHTSTLACINACKAAERLDASPLMDTLLMALKLLAKRWSSFDEELKQIDKQLRTLTQSAAPNLLNQFGIGPLVRAKT